MIHEATNGYQEHSRLVKAMRFADILGPLCQDAIEGSNEETVPQLAERLPDDCWLKADEKIRIATGRKSPNKLPSDATKAMTIAILEERYQNDVPPVTPQERVDRLFKSDVRHDDSKVSPLEQQMYGEDDPFEGIPDPSKSAARGEAVYR